MTLKDFTSGEVLTADDVDEYLKNSIFARKTGTESVTSSTTFQDDDHLSVSVGASKIYEVNFNLIYDGDEAGDLKMRFAGPSGADFVGSVCGLVSGATSDTEDTTREISSISFEVNLGCRGNGSTRAAHGRGLLIVAGTAGTFKVQWAQITSNGTATRLFANSYIQLRRVD